MTFTREMGNLRFLVHRVEVMDLTIMINDEDLSQTDTNSSIRDGICVSIAKASIEWSQIIWK
jgi:hypothetical protein